MQIEKSPITKSDTILHFLFSMQYSTVKANSKGGGANFGTDRLIGGHEGWGQNAFQNYWEGAGPCNPHPRSYVYVLLVVSPDKCHLFLRLRRSLSRSVLIITIFMWTARPSVNEIAFSLTQTHTQTHTHTLSLSLSLSLRYDVPLKSLLAGSKML